MGLFDVSVDNLTDSMDEDCAYRTAFEDDSMKFSVASLQRSGGTKAVLGYTDFACRLSGPELICRSHEATPFIRGGFVTFLVFTRQVL